MQEEPLVPEPEFRPRASRVPLIVTGIAAFVGGALLASLVTAASMGDKAKAKPETKKPAPPPSASASAGAKTADAGSAKKSPIDLARSWDKAARKAVEQKPLKARSADETLTLSYAKAEDKKQAAEELVRKIGLVPKLIKEDKDVGAKIKDLVKDREVAPYLLGLYAHMDGEVGPNLLYDVVTSTRKDDETGDLAEQLLYSKDVYSKASRALLVVLDLRKAEKCEEVPKLLERARDVGDRRALVPLIRFSNKRGCGEKETDDCWPCLRDGDLLKDAMIQVQKRSPP